MSICNAFLELMSVIAALCTGYLREVRSGSEGSIPGHRSLSTRLGLADSRAGRWKAAVGHASRPSDGECEAEGCREHQRDLFVHTVL
jgi:hypothetical protein